MTTIRPLVKCSAWGDEIETIRKMRDYAPHPTDYDSVADACADVSRINISINYSLVIEAIQAWSLIPVSDDLIQGWSDPDYEILIADLTAIEKEEFDLAGEKIIERLATEPQLDDKNKFSYMSQEYGVLNSARCLCSYAVDHVPFFDRALLNRSTNWHGGFGRMFDALDRIISAAAARCLPAIRVIKEMSPSGCPYNLGISRDAEERVARLAVAYMYHLCEDILEGMQKSLRDRVAKRLGVE